MQSVCHSKDLGELCRTVLKFSKSYYTLLFGQRKRKLRLQATCTHTVSSPTPTGSRGPLLELAGLGWVPWTRPREPVHCGACGRRQAARVGDRRDPSSTRPHASARWLRLRVRPPGRRHSSRLPARRRSPGSGPPREEFAGFDTPGRCSTSVRNFSAAVAPRYRASTAANPPLRVSRGVVISRVPSCASSRRAARPSCRWARSAAHVVPPVPSFLPLAA